MVSIYNAFVPGSPVCVEVSQPSLMQATLPMISPYSVYSTICTNCSISSIDEHSLEKPFLLKVTDMLGRETKPISGQPFLYIFSDGSVEKKMIVE